MTPAPIPVVFEPLFKPKPWGGRRLAELFGKPLPGDEPIGESWELADLPENETRVRKGPLQGTGLHDLVTSWGADLLGHAEPVDGRFPLLVKFLDASEHLSVQVHPKPAPDDPQGRRPGIKHEAWYVLHAEPDAKLFIGLEHGIGPDDLARVANTPEMVDALRVWEGEPDRCFYLPSGTLHALGAGLVVAEVQTPSDITFRAYDWGRVGLDGKPRKLHIAESLANIRYDVTDQMIDQSRAEVTAKLGPATRVAACDRFTIDRVHIVAGHAAAIPPGEMIVWMIRSGAGKLVSGAVACEFWRGDTVLIPARSADVRVSFDAETELLEVLIPRR